MAEIIGVTAASLEIGKVVLQLKQKLQAIQNAPDEIRELVDETTRLNGLLSWLSRQQSAAFSNAQPVPEISDIQENCQETANKLLRCARDLEGKIHRARWPGSFKAAFKEKDLQKLRQKLESAKSSLSLAQSTFLFARYHERILSNVDTDILMQAATMHDAGSQCLAPTDSRMLQVVSQKKKTQTNSKRFLIDQNTKHRCKSTRQYGLMVPAKWLGWSLQLRAWRYLNEWTFSIRTWNHRPDDSPIFQFALAGDYHAIWRLLSNEDASVRDLNSNGDSALHLATSEGHFDVARLLIENGADVNHCNALGITCLPRFSCLLGSGQTVWASMSRVLSNVNNTGGIRAFLDILESNGYEDFINDTGWLMSNCNGEWDLYVTNKGQRPSRLVLSYTWPPSKELTLPQRLQNCSRGLPINPEVYMAMLGQPISVQCLEGQLWRQASVGEGTWDASSIWENIAFGLGAILRMLEVYAEGRYQKLDLGACEEFLEGWRSILRQAIQHGGANFFGTGSVLNTFLLARLRDFEFDATREGIVAQQCRAWISELQQAGMSNADLESYSKHEAVMLSMYLLSFPMGSPSVANCFPFDRCYCEVSWLESGPNPSDWRVFGPLWLEIDKANEASAEELSQNVPGAWREDNEEGQQEEAEEDKEEGEAESEIEIHEEESDGEEEDSNNEFTCQHGQQGLMYVWKNGDDPVACQATLYHYGGEICDIPIALDLTGAVIPKFESQDTESQQISSKGTEPLFNEPEIADL